MVAMFRRAVVVAGTAPSGCSPRPGRGWRSCRLLLHPPHGRPVDSQPPTDLLVFNPLRDQPAHRFQAFGVPQVRPLPSDCSPDPFLVQRSLSLWFPLLLFVVVLQPPTRFSDGHRVRPPSSMKRLLDLTPADGLRIGDRLRVLAGLDATEDFEGDGDSHATLRAFRASTTAPDRRSSGRQIPASWPAAVSASSHTFCSGRVRPLLVFSSRKKIRPSGWTKTQSGKPGSDRRELWVWYTSQP